MDLLFDWLTPERRETLTFLGALIAAVGGCIATVLKSFFARSPNGGSSTPQNPVMHAEIRGGAGNRIIQNFGSGVIKIALLMFFVGLIILATGVIASLLISKSEASQLPIGSLQLSCGAEEGDSMPFKLTQSEGSSVKDLNYLIEKYNNQIIFLRAEIIVDCEWCDCQRILSDDLDNPLEYVENLDRNWPGSIAYEVKNEDAPIVLYINQESMIWPNVTTISLPNPNTLHNGEVYQDESEAWNLLKYSGPFKVKALHSEQADLDIIVTPLGFVSDDLKRRLDCTIAGFGDWKKFVHRCGGLPQPSSEWINEDADEAEDAAVEADVIPDPLEELLKEIAPTPE